MKTENFALAVKVKTTWLFEEVTRIKVFPNLSANKSTCGIIFRVLRITFFTRTFEEHPVWNINLLCEIRLALITAQLCFRYCKVTSSWHKIIPRTYCLSFHMIILCPYPKIIPDYVRRPSVIHTRCTFELTFCGLFVGADMRSSATSGPFRKVPVEKYNKLFMAINSALFLEFRDRLLSNDFTLRKAS